MRRALIVGTGLILSALLVGCGAGSEGARSPHGERATAADLAVTDDAFAGAVPLVTFPKLKGVGRRLALTMGVTPVPPSSTAPISIPAPCGRVFPKKSVVGAPVAVPLSTAGPAVIE